MAELIFNASDLRKLKRQCLHHNAFPSELYHHRSDGTPLAEVLNSILDDCVAQLRDMSEPEVRQVVDSLSQGYRSFLEPFPDVVSDEYLNRIAEYCVGNEIQKNFSPVSDVIETHPQNSDVLALCPELASRIDDDGLLTLDKSFSLYDGGVRYGDYFLHYHQFLRRGFSANPNFDFTGTLARQYTNNSADNAFRVAIDHRRIMKFADWRQMIEMDTWYGPRFDREKLDDPEYVGLTVVGRTYGNFFDSYPLDRTEFLWKTNEVESVKTLEIEEMSSPNRPYDNWHINRYVHSERDMPNHTFRHLDGAAKVYPTNTYGQRVESTMPNNARPSHYVKLFRIDGSIDLDDWLSLVSMFYKGNEMIIEYFDPDLYNEKYLPRRKRHHEAMK